ncbi:Asparaginase [Candidatus Electrothrix aarhusensis]|uniref:Asparaginase n=1 Tax=Candidatus Electrothrix aarhusensis TaxID=1859131 RepID=A0A444IS60_9BACT|nr:Asparaginase [Candidatus Electrothrix aarhusensis]
MDVFKRAIVTHGGAGSDPQNSDGPESAAKVGMDFIENGGSALDAVLHAVRYLEDDPRFNAGIGSQIRADGRTIQLDASCMTSNGQFGAVACVEGIQNPVDIAHGVLLYSPHILIVGQGARIFAEEQKISLKCLNGSGEGEIDRNDKTPSCDTVGAVAFDGTTFAAALSSGGLEKSASDESATSLFPDAACSAALQEQLPAPEMANISPSSFWRKKSIKC